jgi:hypothetical protein
MSRSPAMDHSRGPPSGSRSPPERVEEKTGRTALAMRTRGVADGHRPGSPRGSPDPAAIRPRPTQDVCRSSRAIPTSDPGGPTGTDALSTARTPAPLKGS